MGKKGASDEPAPSAQDITEALTNALLRETIEKLEDQKVKLLLNIKGLVEKLAQQKQDQADIYYYLNKKLDDNFEVISMLEEQIISEQADREAAEKRYEKKIEEQKLKAQSDEIKHQGRISELEEKLQLLKDFSDQKESLDEGLLKLVDTLETERKQFKTNVEDLERKAASDREKLKREYECLIVEYRNDIANKVDQRLSKATKNTRAVNLCMKNELKYQSNTVEKVMELADDIIERDRGLNIELSIAQTNEKEIVTRLTTYQRMIKQLNARIDQLEAERADDLKAHTRAAEAKDKTIKQLSATVDNLQNNISRENEQLDDVWKALSETYAMIKLRRAKKNPPMQLGPNASVGGPEPPVDHDTILHEVFCRMVRKFPHKFKNILVQCGGAGLFTGGAGGSLASGSRGGPGGDGDSVSVAASNATSRDSLLFPRIPGVGSSAPPAPGSSMASSFKTVKQQLKAISGGIALGASSGGGDNVPMSINLSSHATSMLSQKQGGGKNAGMAIGSSSNTSIAEASGSVATGIPSWDKGAALVASAGASTTGGEMVESDVLKEAQWWLRQQGNDLTGAGKGGGAGAGSGGRPGGHGMDDSESEFGDSALSGRKIGAIAEPSSQLQVGFGDDEEGQGSAVVGDKAENDPLDAFQSADTIQQPAAQSYNLNSARRATATAAVQTEGQVSVFPPNSNWNSDGPGSVHSFGSSGMQLMRPRHSPDSPLRNPSNDLHSPSGSVRKSGTNSYDGAMHGFLNSVSQDFPAMRAPPVAGIARSGSKNVNSAEGSRRSSGRSEAPVPGGVGGPVPPPYANSPIKGAGQSDASGRSKVSSSMNAALGAPAPKPTGGAGGGGGGGGNKRRMMNVRRVNPPVSNAREVDYTRHGILAAAAAAPPPGSGRKPVNDSFDHSEGGVSTAQSMFTDRSDYLSRTSSRGSPTGDGAGSRFDRAQQPQSKGAAPKRFVMQHDTARALKYDDGSTGPTGSVSEDDDGGFSLCGSSVGGSVAQGSMVVGGGGRSKQGRPRRL